MKGAEKHSSYPLNAPGLFYVGDGACMGCEASERVAPELIGRESDRDGFHRSGESYHCYFKEQPTTAEQQDLAIRACVMCCMGAVRYAGDDPKVLQRMLDLGGATGVTYACDAFSDLSPSQIRGRIARAMLKTDPLWDPAIDERDRLV